MPLTPIQAVIECMYSSLILKPNFPNHGLWGKFKRSTGGLEKNLIVNVIV